MPVITDGLRGDVQGQVKYCGRTGIDCESDREFCSIGEIGSTADRAITEESHSGNLFLPNFFREVRDEGLTKSTLRRVTTA